MKLFYILIFAFFLIPFTSSAQLDEEFWGTYKGEIPSYTTLINDNEVLIKSQEITVVLANKSLVYQLSGAALEGSYVVVDDKRRECMLKGEVSNGRSLNLKLIFRLDKKKNILYLESTNDQPETELVLIEEE